MDQLTKFAERVRDMRKAQNEYFRASRNKNYSILNDALKKSKELEKEVDQVVVEVLSGKQTELRIS